MKHTEEMEDKRNKANILAKITLAANVVCIYTFNYIVSKFPHELRQSKTV